MVCQLDSIVPVESNGKLAMKIEHFGKKRPKWINFMRTFGEAGVVTLVSGDKIKDKTDF